MEILILFVVLTGIGIILAFTTNTKGNQAKRQEQINNKNIRMNMYRQEQINNNIRMNMYKQQQKQNRKIGVYRTIDKAITTGQREFENFKQWQQQQDQNK